MDSSAKNGHVLTVDLACNTRVGGDNLLIDFQHQLKKTVSKIDLGLKIPFAETAQPVLDLFIHGIASEKIADQFLSQRLVAVRDSKIAPQIKAFQEKGPSGFIFHSLIMENRHLKLPTRP